MFGNKGKIGKVDNWWTSANTAEERIRACQKGIPELNRIEQSSRLKPEEQVWLNNLRNILEDNLKNPR